MRIVVAGATGTFGQHVVDAVHAASTKRSVRFFDAVTRNLLAAERAAGVPHHVGVSVISAEKVPVYYYAGKALQEKILMAEQGGWSLIRVAQFHEFAVQLAGQRRPAPPSEG